MLLPTVLTDNVAMLMMKQSAHALQDTLATTAPKTSTNVLTELTNVLPMPLATTLTVVTSAHVLRVTRETVAPMVLDVLVSKIEHTISFRFFFYFHLFHYISVYPESSKTNS